jgi:hypothetical protein
MGENIQFTEIVFVALVLGPWLMALSSGGGDAGEFLYSAIVLVGTIAVTAAALIVGYWIFGNGFYSAVIALVVLNIWMFGRISK